MKIFLTIIGILLLQTAQAKSNFRKMPEILSARIKEMITQFEPEPGTHNSSSQWYFSRLQLKTYPILIFELPFIEFKVKPSIEFRWDHKR